MRDFLAFVALLATAAFLWGIVRPHGGVTRKQSAIAALVCFVAFLFAVPKPTPEERAAQEAAEAKETAAKDAEAAKEGHQAILTKAAPGVAGITTYKRSEYPDTYKLVGASMFGRLDELEPAAFYAAAESDECDKVSVGGVSLSASRRDQPTWFVDCDNGNRFMVALPETEEALARLKGQRLAERDRAHDCTQTSVALCSATSSQKEANEVEIVSACDMTVNSSLIGDSDMDWEWTYGYGEGDNMEVVRGFTAPNAFGAELKHRYFCTYNTADERIEKLTVEGPFGSQKVI